MRTATIALGVAQTLGFGSTYYLPAILADGMAQDMGVTPPWIFGAFTVSLLLLAALGPWAGRWIDRHGGRGMLCLSSLLFAAGLALLSAAPNLAVFYLAWIVLGFGMAFGLYEAAFATLTAFLGRGARGAITGVTLIAGFASTVAWPLSAWMEVRYGWRGACLGWAGLHLTLGLAMNLLVPRGRAPDEVPTSLDPAADAEPPDPARDRKTMLILSCAFGAGLFTSTSLAAHLPRLLEQAGTSATAAVAIAALIGPAQVGARLAEYAFLQRVHPLHISRAAMATHPFAVMLLAVTGGPIGAAAFTVLHAAGNGVQTIAKGTLPLVLFGPQGYGRRQGVISAPGRVAQAFAPVAFGLLMERFGLGALWVTAALGVLSTAAFFTLRAERR
jgi:predicted MFS family arabinose efflux permease